MLSGSQRAKNTGYGSLRGNSHGGGDASEGMGKGKGTGMMQRKETRKRNREEGIAQWGMEGDKEGCREDVCSKQESEARKDAARNKSKEGNT